MIEKQQTTISIWLSEMSFRQREQLLEEIQSKLVLHDGVPIEVVVAQLAAGLVAACATDLGLSPLELSSLLRSPRKDALAGLVTVLHNDA